MKNIFDTLRNKFSLYWSLTKSLQTGLLLSTGVAGFMSARCPVINWTTMVGLTVSLFLAIAGSTIINMWFDRDIDALMKRTCNRPLASGKISPEEALRLGLIMSLLGITLAVLMNALFGLIVFIGLFIDVIIYTIWLKRRTAWSIVWGGISGGIPILAGRVLGMNQIDGVGILLTIAILFWIPTHILTFNMRFYDDYQAARIPTFPALYGFAITRKTIAFSSIVAAVSIGIAGWLIGMQWGYLRVLGVLSTGLLLLAITSIRKPSDLINFGLFKYASLYMLASMLLISIYIH